MKTIIIFLLLSLVLVLASCEKEINIQLQGVSPQLVIDATFNDRQVEGACKVCLQRTVDYFTPEQPNLIGGAEIHLSDDLGNSEMLIEDSTGHYSSRVLFGSAGRTYTLEVTVDGGFYAATAIMGQGIVIDSVISHYNDILWGPYEDEGYLLNCYYTLENPYNEHVAIFVKKNGKSSEEIYFSQGIFGFQVEDVFQLNDEAIIEVRNLDTKAYQYYFKVNQLSGADGNFLAAGGTPANPSGNFSNGALGFFAVYSVSIDTLVVYE